MKKRCDNENDNAFPNYGGRGITYCDEWRKYEEFSKWAKSSGYEEGMTLDRIDNDRSYYPENCRWVTPSVQSANRRKPKNNTSGYIGVNYSYGSYRAAVRYEGKRIYLSGFKTAVDAAKARDAYITERGLPHTLNFNEDAR